MIRNPHIRLGLMVLLAFSGSASAQSLPASGSPERTKWIYPKIKDSGKVVRLPNAAEQPMDGSKIVVDITRKGDLQAVNPAIAKLARFVNLYAGAGKKAATVDIVVVMHGNATICSLDDSAYRRHSGVARNPNLPLFKKLKQVGVKVHVCGQALSHKQYGFAAVHEDVTVAVSALTAIVNQQHKGYAYLPMH
ncbi:MAG: DsrE family protein [Gemmataceae bacterium]